jgi:DNA-binding CsgD family transcriptional regulator
MVSIEQLTPRQRDCLRGVADYKSYKQIARDLGISDSMVEKHLRIAREKLGVGSTAEAARAFLAAEGEAPPQVGLINLHNLEPSPDKVFTHDELAGHEYTETGAADLDPPLSPLQTLSMIGRVALGSIVALTLLIACAEGLKMVLI